MKLMYLLATFAALQKSANCLSIPASSLWLLLLLLGGSCIAGRCLGYGTMEFYPRMDSIVNGAGDILFYLVFMAFMWLPGLMEWKEELLWRSYDLNL